MIRAQLIMWRLFRSAALVLAQAGRSTGMNLEAVRLHEQDAEAALRRIEELEVRLACRAPI